MNDLMSYQCPNIERKIFIKKDSVEAIGKVDKIIFDFDGVLVSTSQSYSQTIRRVVDYYFHAILGLDGETGKLVTIQDIQRFRDTGLYNNDWNLSYSIIAYYLAILLKKLQERRALQDFTKRFSEIEFSEVKDFLQTSTEVGEYCKRLGLGTMELASMKDNWEYGLESCLREATQEKETTFQSIVAPILFQTGIEKLSLIESLIPYDQKKPDLLKRLFEESYLGKDLFTKLYGLPSIFNFPESFLEKEAFIPKKGTFEVLCQRFGKFIIYSEKPRDQGVHLLKKKGLIEYFDEERSIFYEDLIESPKNQLGEDVENLNLGKPNPTLFIKLIKKLTCSRTSDSMMAYVGDSIADVLLVENARLQGLSNILFFGVTCSAPHPNQLLSLYAKHGSDVVIDDVNDIPYLYAEPGG